MVKIDTGRDGIVTFGRTSGGEGTEADGIPRARDYNEAYILLFSCAVTRTVLRELTSDMTTATTLLAFRRLVVRRGVARIMYSDNAQIFFFVHGASKGSSFSCKNRLPQIAFNGISLKNELLSGVDGGSVYPVPQTLFEADLKAQQPGGRVSRDKFMRA
ncbi:hypothetical protein HPB50_020436 [Hyalomma asiaticum]|uniref:Uncharacterized protein n=1 Tax=Hyalomma asiaticum TaxID=266040 RepID=A0ACB7S0X5_HYAAI|nr:hypothetical protein HPB50_020436 [Hyalomma asiaticum]